VSPKVIEGRKEEVSAMIATEMPMSSATLDLLPVPQAGNGRHEVAAIEIPGGDVVDSPLMFEHVRKIAEMIAYGAFCPKHLKQPDNERTVATCFRIAAQAVRWKVDPFGLADQTYEVGGKLGYQGKIIAAVINARAGLDGRLSYEFHGEGDGLTVTVSGKFRNETTPRTVTVTLGQAKTGNSMWTKDPEQKLCYTGAVKWARRHCPEVVEGLLTVEDLELITENNAIPPESEEEKARKRQAAAAAQRAALAGGSGATAPESAAGGNGAATAPTNSAPPASRSKTNPANPTTTPIGPEKKARVIELCKAGGIEGALMLKMASRLSGRTIGKLSDVTELHAAALIGELLLLQPGAGADSARKDIEASKEAPSAPAAVSPSTPPASTPEAIGDAAEPPVDETPAPPVTPVAPAVDPYAGLAETPGSITEEQRAKLAALRTESNWQHEGPGGVQEFFAKNHVQTIRNLSAKQAARAIVWRERVKGGEVGAKYEDDCPF